MTDTIQAQDSQDLPPKAQPRRGRALFLLVLLLALLAVLLLPHAPNRDMPVDALPNAPSAPVSRTTPSTDLDALKAQLAQQEERIAALEAKASAAPETPAAESEAAPKPMEVLQMGQQIAETRAALDHLRAETRAQGLPVRQLQLWVLLQQVSQNVDQGGSIALGVAQLKEAWVGTAPSELEALRILARNTEQRIPTDASLMQDFLQLRGDVSIGLLQKEAGLWARMKAMLREQVRIRKLDADGTAVPSDALAALDEAQDALAEGQTEDAVRFVENIPQGKTAFEPWLEAAKRRLAAQDAVRELQQSLLAQLTAQPAASDESDDGTE